jgi:DNA primase
MSPDEYLSFIPQAGKEDQAFYLYERQILQMVVRYGEQVMCMIEDEEGNERPVTVIEFVVASLKEDDLAFHNPLHRRMLADAVTHLSDDGFLAARFFANYPDPEISRISSDLLSDRYQLSKYHSKYQKVVTDDQRLSELIPRLLLDFKNAIVTAEIKHTLPLLQDPAVARDQAKCNELMRHWQRMHEVQRMMVKQLGDRALL